MVGPSEMADPMSVGFKLNPWRPARTDTNGGGNCEAIRRLTTRAATLIVACVDATVLIIVASYVMLVAYYVAGRGERAWLLGYCGIVMVLLLLNGQYRRRITLTAARDVGPLFLCLAGGVLILEVIPGGRMAAAECLRIAAVALVPIWVFRCLTYALIRSLRRRGFFTQPTLIVGAGLVASQFATTIAEHREFGLQPVGFLDNVDGQGLPYPVLDGIGGLSRVLLEHQIERVVIAFGATRESDMIDVFRACSNVSVTIHVMPRFFELGFAAGAKNVDDIWGYPILCLPRATLHSSMWEVKRVVDVTVAGLGLLLLAPLIGVLALVVKRSSPGPVYFRQRRIGQRGDVVEILKFRSMRVNSDSDTTWNVVDDDRVTKIGRVMRRMSLDEIPQLWNVIRGDMSLVGPRPERPHFVDRFKTDIPGYEHRHRVPVGLTGLAQVNGLRGDTSVNERAWFDNYYIENWSFWRDLVILGRTLGAVIRHACSPDRSAVNRPVTRSPAPNFDPKFDRRRVAQSQPGGLDDRGARQPLGKVS